MRGNRHLHCRCGVRSFSAGLAIKSQTGDRQRYNVPSSTVLTYSYASPLSQASWPMSSSQLSLHSSHCPLGVRIRPFFSRGIIQIWTKRGYFAASTEKARFMDDSRVLNSFHKSIPSAVLRLDAKTPSQASPAPSVLHGLHAFSQYSGCTRKQVSEKKS